VNKKLFWILPCIAAVIAILFFAGRHFIFNKVKDALTEKLESLKEEGIFIQFDSLNFDPWKGHLSAQDLSISVGMDSAHLVLQGSANQLIVDGIEIIPLIIRKSLTINRILLKDPTLIYSKAFQQPVHKKGDQTKEKKKLRHVAISNITMSNASFLLRDSLKNDTTVSINMDLLVRHLELDQEEDSLVLKKADLSFSPVDIITPNAFYRYSIQKMSWSTEDKSFTIDSLKVIPLYDRSTFMKKAGEQTSRMEALVPHLLIEGLAISGKRQMSIAAEKATVNFTLHVFRDKRYPFLKKTVAEMPMEFLQKLPFQLSVDTIKIKNSFVKYEEFPEKGDSTGYVFFDKMNSTIVHLHNKAVEKEDVTMRTTALFMGKGKLDARFVFPSDTTKAYTTTGSLKDFPLTLVNEILVPSFQTRIESGIMTDFNFNFIYNKTRSDGNVELNYNELKIISMKKDKNDKTIISKFKTAVINLFVLKRNSEQTESGDKKTGTILYYRNPRRAIFHFWWKSLFSGLVTAYKLDGLVPDLKDHGKNISSEIKDKAKERKE